MNALLIITHGSHANVIITVCFTPKNLMFSHMVSLLTRGALLVLLASIGNYNFYGIW